LAGKKVKKILFCQGFSLQQQGGGVTIIKRLMAYSNAMGYESFACFDQNEVPPDVRDKINPNEETAIETSSRTTRNPRFSRFNPLLKLLILLGIDQKAKSSFSKLLRRIEPDVIHITAHGLSFPLFFFLAKKWGKAKVVISVHDLWQFTIWDKYPRRLLDYLFKRCLRSAGHCYVISPEMGEYLKAKYGILSYTVVHDGYAATSNLILSEKLSNSFLYVGILTDSQRLLLDRIAFCMSSVEGSFTIGVCSNTTYTCSNYKNVHVENYGWVAQERLNEISLKYMYGILPLSFEPSRSLFYQTSLMTKIPFYFSAALPVYCIGEEDSSSVKLIQREKAGICCTNPSDQLLVESVTKITELSKDAYCKMVKHTQDSLATTFNINLIVERFYSSLN
jgi:hypothetical protein